MRNISQLWAVKYVCSLSLSSFRSFCAAGSTVRNQQQIVEAFFLNVIASGFKCPLRKFEQFPAQKMHQNLRWTAQIWPGLPRWTSAIPALGRASLAPSAGEMDEL